MNNGWLKRFKKWEKWEFMTLFSHKNGNISHKTEYFDKKRKENTKM